MKKGYKIPQLALRMVRERTLTLPYESVLTPAHATGIAHRMIGDKPIEFLIAICLDGRGHVTGVTTISQGGMHGASVRMPDVLRAVLAAHASAFILAHNHPSGDPAPSEQDIEITTRIRDGATLVGVPLLDHVVVVRSGDWRSINMGAP